MCDSPDVMFSRESAIRRPKAIPMTIALANALSGDLQRLVLAVADLLGRGPGGPCDSMRDVRLAEAVTRCVGHLQSNLFEVYLLSAIASATVGKRRSLVG